MKRTVAILMAVLTMFLIAGCDMGSTATQKNSTQQGQQDTKNTQSSKTAARQAVVCELPGLGDTRTAWTAEWGSPTAQGDTIRLFNNGAYKTIFDGDKAITITFASKDGKNPLPETMVPKDGKKLSESSKKRGIPKWSCKNGIAIYWRRLFRKQKGIIPLCSIWKEPHIPTLRWTAHRI